MGQYSGDCGVKKFYFKSMKDTEVHLNTNGNNPVEEDNLVIQEMMAVTAGVKSVRRRGWAPALRWPSAGRDSSSIAEERQADGVSLDSHGHGGDNI